MSQPSDQPRLIFRRRDLIVLAVVFGLFALLVLPFIAKVREAQDQLRTTSNLKGMGIAVHSFSDVHKRLPPAFEVFDKVDVPASLHVYLLPFVSEDNLYKAVLAKEGGQGTNEAIVPCYASPGDPSGYAKHGTQNFAASLRVFSKKGVDAPYDAPMPKLAELEPGQSTIRDTIEDGTSNTIVFATKYSICGPGGSKYAAHPASPFAAFFGESPAQKPAHPSGLAVTFQLKPTKTECLCSPLMAQSFGAWGISVGLADASVRNVNPAISAETWNRAMQPNDGQQLGTDWQQ